MRAAGASSSGQRVVADWQEPLTFVMARAESGQLLDWARESGAEDGQRVDVLTLRWVGNDAPAQLVSDLQPVDLFDEQTQGLDVDDVAATLERLTAIQTMIDHQLAALTAQDRTALAEPPVGSFLRTGVRACEQTWRRYPTHWRQMTRPGDTHGLVASWADLGGNPLEVVWQPEGGLMQWWAGHLADQDQPDLGTLVQVADDTVWMHYEPDMWWQWDRERECLVGGPTTWEHVAQMLNAR